MSEINIAKRGESVFTLSFRRLNGRVRVYVKAHESIENLVKSWGNGQKGDLYDFGSRHWIFDSGTRPKVYDISALPIDPTPFSLNSSYSLNLVGQPLFNEVAPGRMLEVINISFLRIVGISQGVEFELDGVFSVTYLQNTQSKIQQAIKRLYTDYLLPIDLTAQVVTQETRL